MPEFFFRPRYGLSEFSATKSTKIIVGSVGFSCAPVGAITTGPKPVFLRYLRFFGQLVIF